jgi:hypothetical protein
MSRCLRYANLGGEGSRHGVERAMKGREERVSTFSSTFYLSTVIHLNDQSHRQPPLTSSGPTQPHSRLTLDTVMSLAEREQVKHVHHLPSHLLVRFLEIDPRSAEEG